MFNCNCNLKIINDIQYTACEQNNVVRWVLNVNKLLCVLVFNKCG